MSIKVTDWNLSPKAAIELQKELRKQVQLTPLTREPRVIAGCDVSMNRFAKEGYAGFVILNYPELEIIETATVRGTIPFPYIPGLLSFREIPMLEKAWAKLKTKPEVIFVDGVGIAHPRRLGIATHLGLVLNLPTIGCAKSVLYGHYEEPDQEPGSVSYLKDPKTGEVIGTALRTKRSVKPMFISPGHLITLEESLALVKTCIRKHRLPEPTRYAHRAVNEARIADTNA